MDKKIAILGATSHIAKGLIFNFCRDSTVNLHLFARSPERTKEFLNNINCRRKYPIKTISGFGSDKDKYKVVINCIGMGAPALLEDAVASIFELTEIYDNLIISYLKKNNDSLYINFGSGAAYGIDFTSPVNDLTPAKWDINNIKESDYYGIAKLNSEAKHRALKNLNIVDLRIFGYFSRFMDLQAKYLLSEIILCVKNRTVFVTEDRDIVRDYIHPQDLFSLVGKCMTKMRINNSFNAYSRKPVKKIEILDYFRKTYGLEYKIKKNIYIASATGNKENYYAKSSKAKKLGYFPKFTSLDSISKEIEPFLSNCKEKQ